VIALTETRNTLSEREPAASTPQIQIAQAAEL
jgi:hypothetical protein